MNSNTSLDITPNSQPNSHTHLRPKSHSNLQSRSMAFNKVKNCKPKKIIIAGDGGTGKSTLIMTKEKGKFAAFTKMTIGVDFHILRLKKKTNYKNEDKENINTFSNYNENDNMLVFDLGGQERFHFMHRDYVRGGQAAIILYDLTRERTFSNMQKWYKMLINVNPTIQIILAGSKLDEVEPEDVNHFKKSWIQLDATGQFPNIKKHHVFSSKTYQGVDELFEILENLITPDTSKLLEELSTTTFSNTITET